MEDRTLLSAVPVNIVSLGADNRGSAQIVFSKTVNPATINTNSVKIYAAGKDHIIGTADDTPIAEKVSLNKYKTVLTISASVPADVTYRIDLNSKLIKDTDGLRLDGEYSGHFHTGNGVQGGDFNVKISRNGGPNPVVRFTTNYGNIDVELFRGATGSDVATPNTVAYFLGYVNSGSYDNQMVTRDVPTFIVQWGKVKVNPTTGALSTIKTIGSLTPDPINSNVAGTIAFALSGDQTTAQSEFFFNMADNSFLDNPFTAFGKVANSTSFNVLKKINALDRLNLNNTAPINGFGTLVDNVPVNSGVKVTGETSGAQGEGGTTTQTIHILSDFVLISRVAVLSNVGQIK